MGSSGILVLSVLLAQMGAGAAGQCDREKGTLVDLAAEMRLVRGHDLARAGLCMVCHTDSENGGAAFTGGRAIKTPFGNIYSTNLTPDRETGIGAWTDEEFVRAVKRGIHKNGSNLFPAFPYTSFANMTDEDVISIRRYLATLPATRQPNRPVEIKFPFNSRLALWGWKLLYLKWKAWKPDPKKSPSWNRGSYLVEGVAHCAECHSERNFMGGIKSGKRYAGVKDGPEGFTAPNITPDDETGIGRWTQEELVRFLKTGRKPDGNSIQALKEEVIGHGFRYMSDEDLNAMAEYIRSLKPIKNDPRASR